MLLHWKNSQVNLAISVHVHLIGTWGAAGLYCLKDSTGLFIHKCYVLRRLYLVCYISTVGEFNMEYVKWCTFMSRVMECI